MILDNDHLDRGRCSPLIQFVNNQIRLFGLTILALVAIVANMTICAKIANKDVVYTVNWSNIDRC